MVHNRGTYREGGHREGVDVTLPRRASYLRQNGNPRKAFWGHIFNTSLLEGILQVTSERGCDPEVPETRLAIPSNENVALDAPGSACGLTRFPVLPTGVILPCKIPNP